METEVARALLAHRREIRRNWETLLRLERPSSPLANPDMLVHRLDRTLDEIFANLVLGTPRAHPRVQGPQCPCGLNPWLAYLSAGRQALREALVDVQTALPRLTHPARDDALAGLEQVLDHIARREIESFCALCQFRPKAHPATVRPAHHAQRPDGSNPSGMLAAGLPTCRERPNPTGAEASGYSNQAGCNIGPTRVSRDKPTAARPPPAGRRD